MASASHSFPHTTVVSERLFFLAMCVLIFAGVFYGFRSDYVVAGPHFFPFATWLVYIHAAFFSAWMILLVAQATLVSAGRVVWHRHLGLAGFFLACAMPVLGAVVATGLFARNDGPPGVDPWVLYYQSVASMVAFPLLVYFAFRYRHSPPSHKRLILLATLVIAEAGTFRWPVRWVHEFSHGVSIVTYSFLLLLVLFDFYSRRKIHPATLCGGLFLIFYEETGRFIGRSHAWHAAAAWIVHFWPKSN
jgi:hypothetical protein